MNIAVLASGNGSNFEAIAKAVKSRYLKAKVKLLITDKQKALCEKEPVNLKLRIFLLTPRITLYGSTLIRS